MYRKFAVYNPLESWKKGDLPVDPIVEIVVENYQVRGPGRISITATLASDSEIDFAIDSLIGDLNEIRKRAKATLTAQRRKLKTE